MTNNQLHHYDSLFYRYQREGSLRSARTVLPVVTSAFTVRSVLDVGCGAGAWLAVHRELGAPDLIGVDGDYVDRSLLLIDKQAFRPTDITRQFDLGRQFDLVQCLEVAEHVQPQASEVVVDNIVRHGRRVLFSAAAPGQGGEDHVNEQPYDYWRDLFAERHYRLFDFVRPSIASLNAVEAWYRYNILFFAHDSVIEDIPEVVRATQIPESQHVRDYSPPGYRLRKLILRQLPSAAVSRLAIWKHQRAVRSLRQK